MSLTGSSRTTIVTSNSIATQKNRNQRKKGKDQSQPAATMAKQISHFHEGFDMGEGFGLQSEDGVGVVNVDSGPNCNSNPSRVASLIPLSALHPRILNPLIRYTASVFDIFREKSLVSVIMANGVKDGEK